MIWVVDSDPIALKVTSLTLSRSFPEAQIITFDGPRKLLELLDLTESSQLPKLIISDVHFPLMDADTYIHQLTKIAKEFAIECLICTVLPIQHYTGTLPEQIPSMKYSLKPFTLECLVDYHFS